MAVVTQEAVDTVGSILAVLGSGGGVAVIWLSASGLIFEAWSDKRNCYVANIFISMVLVVFCLLAAALMLTFLESVVMWTGNAWVYDAGAAVAILLFILGIVIAYWDSKKEQKT